MTYVYVAKQDAWLTCMLRNKMHDLPAELWSRDANFSLRLQASRSFWLRFQAKFLTYEIADFTPFAHAQSDVPGHAFRKRWLFAEISIMLRTDY